MKGPGCGRSMVSASGPAHAGSDLAVDPTRREMLHQGARVLSAVFLASLIFARARADASCSNSSSEALRMSLHYSDLAPNPDQSCRMCGFFTEVANKPSCGSCMIMSDSVNPKGHCDSWAAKS